MKKNLCFLRQSGSSHAHRSFIDQSTAGLALCGFWRYPYRLSTRLSRPFVGNPAFIHKLPKASPPPVDRTSGQFLSNFERLAPPGSPHSINRLFTSTSTGIGGNSPRRLLPLFQRLRNGRILSFSSSRYVRAGCFRLLRPLRSPSFLSTGLHGPGGDNTRHRFVSAFHPNRHPLFTNGCFRSKTDQPPESPAGRCPEATANTLFTFGSTVFVDWTGYPATGVEPRG